MKRRDKTKKRLMSEAHAMAKDLHDVGAIDMITMREFDALCLSHLDKLSPMKIKKLRVHAGFSQSVFAKVINVSIASIKQWERGERRPSGAALKLLNIIESKGIEVAF